MSDLHTEKQLVAGFYNLEAGAWRWTGKTFSVALAVPQGASAKGAVLTLQGTVTPDTLAAGPLQINVAVGDTPLAPKTVSTPGELIYQADVPASALDVSTVLAQYTLSATHHAPNDQRDLGIIASVFSLHTK